ncbi:MAG: hypothetical protein ACO3EZ_13415 [Prochlorotrichaceae cyanobacterium]
MKTDNHYTRYTSIKAQTKLLLQQWGQGLVSPTQSREDNPVHPRGDIWKTLPLKRSRFATADGVYPLVYQSAFFPWLASVFPHPEGVSFWEAQCLALLPLWVERYSPNVTLEILPRHGFRIGISGEAIVTNLRQWLKTPRPIDSQSLAPLRQRLWSKTGEGCEIQYYHDRCQQLLQLAHRQHWLPDPPPWAQLTWQSFQQGWHTDATRRSLLEAWSDHSDDLLYAPQRLITGIPQFLHTLEQYDRAHSWGSLAQTLAPETFWGHAALIAASDRVLEQVLR